MFARICCHICNRGTKIRGKPVQFRIHPERHIITMPVQDERRELRAQLRQRRRDIPAPERIAAAQTLAERLLHLPFAPTSGYVAGYWALDGEIALHAWQLGLPYGVDYCLPVLAGPGQLQFAPWSPGAPLTPNRYGIPEPAVDPHQLLAPEQIQLAVVPLVGFDRGGARLGMGAGYYDRSFAPRQSAMPPPWLVGVGFATQQVDAIEQAPWDVRMDAICTERETILCQGATA